MGKKVKFTKENSVNDLDYIENLDEDGELEAEMKALASIHEQNSQKPNKKSSLTYLNNESALLQTFQQLPTSNLPFKETYCVSEKASTLLENVNEHDDLQRETAFYEHSLHAVQIGRKLLSSLGIPFIRPKDYFCEHIKSDAHMGRIKDRLILEEKKIEAFEQRKKRDFERTFAKKVSKVKDSTNNSDSNKNNEKTRVGSGRFNRDVAKTKESNKFDEEKNNRPNNRNNSDSKSFKRKAMDKKYGFGGKDRKRAKLNDQK